MSNWTWFTYGVLTAITFVASEYAIIQSVITSRTLRRINDK